MKTCRQRCLQCKVRWVPTHSWARYCSPRCRRAARNRRAEADRKAVAAIRGPLRASEVAAPIRAANLAMLQEQVARGEPTFGGLYWQEGAT